MLTTIEHANTHAGQQACTMAMDKLAKAVQNLPTELFDEIYELTFTFVAKTCYVDPQTYKPPATLQVDRKSRSTAAKSYYNNTIFTFCAKDFDFEEHTDGTRWFASLPADHIKALREIHVEFADFKYDFIESAALQYLRSEDFGVCPMKFDYEDYPNTQDVKIKRAQIGFDGTMCPNCLEALLDNFDTRSNDSDNDGANDSEGLSSNEV